MFDDYMFPTTSAGLRRAGIFESASNEDDSSDIGEGSFSDIETRTRAMSAVLTWVEEGEYTYDALDETVIAVSDLDGDFDISEEEELAYSDIWGDVPYALLTLGATMEDVQAVVDGQGKEADDAAARIGAALKESLDNEEDSDIDIINDFALGDDDIFESAEGNTKRVKVIRDMKPVFIKKRISGKKKRLSALEKARNRKASRKSHAAGVERRRAKSRRAGEKRGLYAHNRK